MDVKIKKLNTKTDARGWLAEIVTPKDIAKKDFGLLLVTTAIKGQTKGGHFHKRKTEYYSVIKGSATLYLEDLKTGEKKEVAMGEENLVMVKIPPFHFHTIANSGNDEMFLMVYVDEPFDAKDPDTFTDRNI